MAKEKRFETVYVESTMMSEKSVIVDKETGVHYLFVASGFGAGLTVLLDEQGKPVIKNE